MSVAGDMEFMWDHNKDENWPLDIQIHPVG